MEKSIIIFICAMLGMNMAYGKQVEDVAHSPQTAILKNGSVLYGYIQNNDGYGNLTFHTDSAIIILKDVTASVTDKTVHFNQLSTYWQEWAEKNDAFSGTPDNRFLLLSDITITAVNAKDDNFLNQMKLKHVNNIRLQERGVKYKYIELSPNAYQLKWNDITTITSERRPKTALSGIDWIYQTKGGQTFEGQYAGEDKMTTSLYLANGVKQTIKTSEVVKYTCHAVNPNQSIIEQSELLDVVHTNSIGTITGIITEKNYPSTKNSENYILIQQDGGIIQSIKLSDIISVSREKNRLYAPEYDLLLTNGEVYVNGEEAKADMVNSGKGKNVLVTFTPINVAMGANRLTTVLIQYSALEIGANVEAFKVVPLKKKGKNKKDIFYFTDEMLATSVYRPVSIGTTVNQTTKAVYQLNGGGDFLFFDISSKKGYAVHVK